MILSHMANNIQDTGLQSLAANITFRVIEAKAPSTVDRYFRAFNQFKIWANTYDEIGVFPAKVFSVALYLEHLLQSQCLYSKLESAYYGINWAHNVYGVNSPCESGLVKNILEAAKRKLSKPVLKKEPVTCAMISEMCTKYANVSVNLSELRLTAICVTAFNAFLRFNELANLRCCDVQFSEVSNSGRFVQLYIAKSKTDIYRDGSTVLMAETNDLSCPFTILSRYTSMNRHHQTRELRAGGPFSEVEELICGLIYSRT